MSSNKPGPHFATADKMKLEQVQVLDDREDSGTSPTEFFCIAPDGSAELWTKNPWNIGRDWYTVEREVGAANFPLSDDETILYELDSSIYARIDPKYWGRVVVGKL